MTAIHVTTQAELDAALNNPKISYAEHEIIICNHKEHQMNTSLGR